MVKIINTKNKLFIMETKIIVLPQEINELAIKISETKTRRSKTCFKSNFHRNRRMGKTNRINRSK